jgi:hypothetical protein
MMVQQVLLGIEMGCKPDLGSHVHYLCIVVHIP